VITVGLRTLLRGAFVAYACLLFVATHWPNLRIRGGGRPDLLVHASVFALWTALLIAAGLFGPALSRRNLLTVAAIAPLYAAFDEVSQAIPALGRTAAFDDYLFDLVGVALALLTAAVFLLCARMRSRDAGTIASTPTQATGETPAR
jgi:hypothetical protein